MRAYRVTVDGRTRYAGTQADAKTVRDELGGKRGKGIEEVEIPTAKAELIAFVNELIEERENGAQDD